MVIAIPPFYSAILAFFYIALSVRTLTLRRALSINLGDGVSDAMLRAARVHGNFAESVPITLLLVGFLELRGGGPATVHLLCTALLAGRLSYAVGVSRLQEDHRFRVFGRAMTFTALGGAGGGLLLSYAR